MPYLQGYTEGGYEPPPVVVPPTPPSLPTPDLRIRIDCVNDINPNMDVMPPPIWSDASDYLRVPGFSLRRGRQRPLDRNEAATATYVMDNLERLFDSDLWEGPFAGIGPMRHTDAAAVFPRTTTAFKVGSSKVGSTDLVGGGPSLIYETLFDGYIQSIDYDYPERGFDATATIQCVDATGVQARPNLSISLDGAHQAWEELHHVLNLKIYTGRVAGAKYQYTGSPDRDISESYGRYVQQDFNQTTMREVLDTIAEADGGNFFISRTGRPTYRDSQWSFRPVGELRFAIDAERFKNVAMALDETLVFNLVTLTGPTGVRTASDISSMARYEERPYEKTLILNDESELQSRADELLLRHSSAERFLKRLDLSNVVIDWRTALTRDPWDLAMIEVPLPNRDTVVQRSQIEGIEISTPNRRDWQVFWWLSVPPFPELLIGSDSGFEGVASAGSTGQWTAETNCTLQAASTQFYHTYYRTGNPHNPGPNIPVVLINPIYAAEGLWVLEADASANGNVSCLSPYIPVDARSEYHAKAKLRLVKYGPGDVLATDLTRPMHLEIDWYDSNSQLLSTDIGASTVVGWTYQGWTLVQASGRAPGGAMNAKLRVKSVGSNTAGVYVDDVHFQRGG